MIRPLRNRVSRRPPARVLAAVAEDAGMGAVRWFLSGPDGRVLMEGLACEGQTGDLPLADRTVLFAPGQDVRVRRIETPDREAKARAYALEQLSRDMSDDPADLAIAVGERDAGGGRLAAAVRHDTLTQWLDRAGRLGLTPDAVAPDSLLPLVPAEHDWTALSLNDRTAMRGRETAFTAEPDLADLAVSGGTVAMMDANALAGAAVIAALEPPLNLLDGPSAPAAGGWRPWRRAMILAVTVLAAPLVMIGAEALRFEIIAGGLERRSHDAVRAAWPEASPDADPADDVRRRLGPVLTGGFSATAAALFSAVEAVEGTSLETLVLDDQGQVRAAVAHRDYADLERLNAVLADHGLILVDESVLEEDGRMVSDVQVAPR